MSQDDFMQNSISFIEEQDWYFGGGIENGTDKETYVHNYLD
ncbi:hypothetical protein [Desulfosporosinus sp. OT]|nr:hypothetical protein [Desulfosporosinus sp. OT]EGW41416.1 hypothetical protein DOT_0624 [Desulfosporosinus sp. OT]